MLGDLLDGKGEYEGIYDGNMAAVYDIFYDDIDWIESQEGLIENHVEDYSSLLELACGTGLLLGHVEDDFSKSTGVDYSEGMLSVAKERCQGTSFHRGDFTSLDCVDDSYNAVVMLGNPINHYPPRIMRDILGAVESVVSEGSLFIYDFLQTDIWVEDMTTNIRRAVDGEYEVMRCDYVVSESKIEPDYYYKKSNIAFKISDESRERSVEVSHNVFSHPVQKHKEMASEFGSIVELDRTGGGKGVMILEF